MSLVGHSLKSGDLFVDVGANIGSYTLLAASLGATCLALEPIPTTFLNLQRNIALNGLTRVTALEVAVGSKRGTLTMTSNFDTINHVITNAEPGIEVQVWSLDDLVIVDRPLGLKIDVEGWEQEVLAGASEVLKSPLLLFVIVEVNESGRRYGHSGPVLLNTLVACGLTQVRYDPWTRQFRSSQELADGNALFVRLPDVAERVSAAVPVRIGNGQLL
jgi:FkbM family methyltransferase